MNALRHLLRDHEEIGKLFKQFVEADEKAHAQKKVIADNVIERIRRHARLEEEILFPAFKKKGGKEAEEMVEEGVEEHRVTKFVMARIKRTRPGDKSFDAKVKVLMESANHHFEEEELEVFPKVKKVLSKDLERLGEEMAAAEKRKK